MLLQFTVQPQASDTAQSIWKVAFYTPEEVVMAWNKAEQAGYSTRLSSSRLVMRSPYNTAETHSEEASDTIQCTPFAINLLLIMQTVNVGCNIYNRLYCPVSTVSCVFFFSHNCAFCINFYNVGSIKAFFFFFSRWLAFPWKCSTWSSTTRSRKGSNLSTWQPHVPLVSALTTTKTQLLDLKFTGPLFQTGGVISDNHTITWYVPRRVTPLVDAIVDLSDVQMGINGKLLDKSQMSERDYTLSGTDFHVVLEMPVGSPDGYYKVGGRLQIPNA